MKKSVTLNADEIIDLYVNQKRTINSIAEEKHVGKLKIQNLLKEHNIPFRKKGELLIKHGEFITDYHVKKYVPKEGKTFIAKCKIDGKEFNDYENSGGFLTSYIRNTLGVEVPPLAKRNVYYMETGNYWYEQYFDIIEVDEKPTKKCPYCDWETTDIDNKSGAFINHLRTVHDKSKLDYLRDFPNDREWFRLVNISKDIKASLCEDEFVTCKICGERLRRIDVRHLSKHNITKEEYIEKYGTDLVAKELHDRLSDIAADTNATCIMPIKSSKDEIEIKEFVSSLGFTVEQNRTVLNGKELDIYIPSERTAIEFNGIKWHTENFGKKGMNYHINKTKIANDKGVNLIQIFEDEYKYNKEIVLSKIKHILGRCQDLPKIMGRKCQIRVIESVTAKEFYNKFHIQGYVISTVHLGALFGTNLIGVMSFMSKGDDKWELTRFATDYNFVCQGVGGKLFKFFVRNYNPKYIYSFADRRWTMSKTNNIYTKLGFTFEKASKPDYRYYNGKVDRYKRFHKKKFKKTNLLKNNPQFTENMTESDMMLSLGYDRIWDCGLFKYVWRKDNN